MRNFANSYSWFIPLLTLSLLFGCIARVPQPEETPEGEARIDPRGFDPLEFQQDRQVVPLERPRTGAITGKQAITVDHITDSAGLTGSDRSYRETPSIDSMNSQAFRVQLFTTKVYSDVRNASRVAEEIFDQPVFVDYEVPYFKVRVGSFPGRTAAESYLERAKAAGYENAWVVMVNVMVREAQPLYEEIEPGGFDDPVPATDNFDLYNDDNL